MKPNPWLLLSFLLIPGSAATAEKNVVLLAMDSYAPPKGQRWSAEPIVCYEGLQGKYLTDERCLRMVPAGAQVRLGNGQTASLRRAQDGHHKPDDLQTDLTLDRASVKGGAMKPYPSTSAFAVWPADVALKAQPWEVISYQPGESERRALLGTAMRLCTPTADCGRDAVEQEVTHAEPVVLELDGDGVKQQLYVLQPPSQGSFDFFARAVGSDAFVQRFHKDLGDRYQVRPLLVLDLDQDGRKEVLLAETYSDERWLRLVRVQGKGATILRVAFPADWVR